MHAAVNRHPPEGRALAAGLAWRCIGAAMLASILVGCDWPRDNRGTLERLESGGQLRVGVAANPPWTTVDAGTVGGIEARLVEGWARELGAPVRFEPGPEAELVERLHRCELDVLIAGLEEKTPYEPKLALTQPYLESVTGANEPGREEKRVMAVCQGESALLLSLDRFLLARGKAMLEREAAQ